MKKSTSIILIVVAVVVGYFLGTIIGIPSLNPNDAKGTISKASKLNNSAITETDIRLRDDIVSDKQMQQNLNDYMALCYMNQASYDAALREAIANAKDVKDLAPSVAKMNNSQKLNNNVGTSVYAFMSDLAALRTNDKKALKSNSFSVNLRNSIFAINTLKMDMDNTAEVLSDFDSYIKANSKADVKRLEYSRDLLKKSATSMAQLSNDRIRMDYLNKLANYYSDEQLYELATEYSKENSQDQNVGAFIANLNSPVFFEAVDSSKVLSELFDVATKDGKNTLAPSENLVKYGQNLGIYPAVGSLSQASGSQTKEVAGSQTKEVAGAQLQEALGAVGTCMPVVMSAALLAYDACGSAIGAQASGNAAESEWFEASTIGSAQGGQSGVLGSKDQAGMVGSGESFANSIGSVCNEVEEIQNAMVGISQDMVGSRQEAGDAH
jgi:hypothetical protein